MAVLGFNELMAVLYNPAWLLLLLLLFLFARTVYLEMDVEAEMARGLLPGAIALSSKFVPAIKKVSRHTLESAKAFLQDAPEASGGSGSGGGGGCPTPAPLAAGLRNRRREVEMTEGAAGTGAPSSRKDD
jgi:hypothetical protein